MNIGVVVCKTMETSKLNQNPKQVLHSKSLLKKSGSLNLNKKKLETFIKGSESKTKQNITAALIVSHIIIPSISFRIFLI
jgi:hypothetical protein